MSESSGGRPYLIGGGAAACAVCCAPPVLALVGIAGAGAVATVATIAFAGLVFGLVVLVASGAAFVLRKRHRNRVFPGDVSAVELVEIGRPKIKQPGE